MISQDKNILVELCTIFCWLEYQGGNYKSPAFTYRGVRVRTLRGKDTTQASPEDVRYRSSQLYCSR